jgi:cytoskeletal protein CcmA (bactofilin family)
MFKLKLNKIKIDTLIDANTRINGDVEFSGGLHLDGHINGNVSGEGDGETLLVVSELAAIEGSVAVSNIILNGIVRGDIDAADRVELGAKAQVFGNVQYRVIESAVGAQINGRLIHKAAPAGPDVSIEAAADREVDRGEVTPTAEPSL